MTKKSQSQKTQLLNPQDKGFHLSFITDGETMIFGFDGNLFESKVNGNRFVCDCLGGHDFRIENVQNAKETTKGNLFQLLGSETGSTQEGYSFKKYVWDTDDCREITIKDLRVSDILLMFGDFYLIYGIEENSVKVVDMAGNRKIIDMRYDLQGKEIAGFRHKCL